MRDTTPNRWNTEGDWCVWTPQGSQTDAHIFWRQHAQHVEIEWFICDEDSPYVVVLHGDRHYLPKSWILA